MNDYLSLLVTFALSLALTLAPEFLIALLFRIRGRDLLLLLLVNILTNPVAVYLNLLFTFLFPQMSVFVWQIPLEVGVVAIEGILYRKLSPTLPKPLLFALVANICSYGIGLCLDLIF